VNRFLVLMLAGAAVTASVAPLHAQEVMERRASRFDAGVYAGGSWTSDWLRVRDQSFRIGYNPIFGGFATLWGQPRLGLRLHGAYIPSRLPQPSDPTQAQVQEGRILNLWFYDLNLMYRPWIERAELADWLAHVYFFAGGGGVTVNVAGDQSPQVANNPDRSCVFPYILGGACLPYSPTTGAQGTLGAGTNLFQLTRNVGVFGELGVHIYDSPFQIREANVDPLCPDECEARDLLAFTPRLVAGLRLAAGRPRPAPPVVVAPPPPPPPLPVEERIRVCVLVDDLPRIVDATIQPATGDTVVVVNGERRPFGAVYPGDPSRLAAGAPFFLDNEPITFMNRRYVRFGVARLLGPGDINRAGEYRGYTVFAEPGAGAPPAVVYLPVRPNCEYQPYRLEQEVQRVRG
jgi:hypothetical protein